MVRKFTTQRMDIATRLEAIDSIAIGLEAIASRLEAIASRWLLIYI